MSYFEFKGRDVFYTIEGKGKPFILLNGIMMSTKSWEPFVNSFIENNMLIRVDFFDQGKTDKLVGELYNHDIQVDLVKALLDHIEHKKVSIVGISYGGEIALQFAIKYADLVDRLVLFNTAAYTKTWLRDIGRGWISSGRSRDGQSYYYTTIPIIYSPDFYQRNIDWMKNREQKLIPIFSDPNFLDAMERLTLSSESFDCREKLFEIKAKTLIISAEEDYLTPLDNQEYLYKNIKNSEWIKIPNSGHGSMYEKPLIFVSLILGFLNTKDIEFHI